MKKILCLGALALHGLAIAADLREANPPIYHATMEEALKAAGLDRCHTERNLEHSRFIYENHAKVLTYLGTAYAGEWVDCAEDGNKYQVIAITRPIDVDASIFPEGHYKFVGAKYAYEELRGVQEKLTDIFMRPDNVNFSLLNSIGIDVHKNKVAIELFPSNAERVRKIMGDFNIDAEMVEMILTWGVYEVAPLKVD